MKRMLSIIPHVFIIKFLTTEIFSKYFIYLQQDLCREFSKKQTFEAYLLHKITVTGS
jgi:hypothetical protein